MSGTLHGLPCILHSGTEPLQQLAPAPSNYASCTRAILHPNMSFPLDPSSPMCLGVPQGSPVHAAGLGQPIGLLPHPPGPLQATTWSPCYHLPEIWPQQEKKCPARGQGSLGGAAGTTPLPWVPLPQGW